MCGNRGAGGGDASGGKAVTGEIWVGRKYHSLEGVYEQGYGKRGFRGNILFVTEKNWRKNNPLKNRRTQKKQNPHTYHKCISEAFNFLG